MYIPSQFQESRAEVLHALIKSHPLSTLVIFDGTELIANHIPLLLDCARGEHGTLRGHVARSNPVWRQLGSGRDALAVFQGPDAYITPNWYPSKQADGKVVPTWNYVAVHAHGPLRAVEDPAWLLALVTELTSEHESRLSAQWRVADAPVNYIDKMIKGIVGIEMPISRIQGKWKVSQNRPIADRQGVIAGLESQPGDESAAMARLVRERAG
jgi:transcriptional regulator